MAKVLIAESTSEKEDFCKKNLVSVGYEVLDAISRQDAISMFIEGRPDVVILDRNLGSSGVDLAEDILYLNRSAKIIVNSRKGDNERRRESWSGTIPSRTPHKRKSDFICSNAFESEILDAPRSALK
jgi:DNA-binding response OmpR family regulator